MHNDNQWNCHSQYFVVKGDFQGACMWTDGLTSYIVKRFIVMAVVTFKYSLTFAAVAELVY